VTEVWWEISLSCTTILLLSPWGKALKISKQLAKVISKNIAVPFSDSQFSNDAEIKTAVINEYHSDLSRNTDVINFNYTHNQGAQ